MTEWLKDIPLYWAKVIAIIFFIVIIIWALTRPKEYIFKGATNRKVWRDLRLWAAIILIVQIIVYLKFS